MGTVYTGIEALKKKAGNGYWEARIIAEIEYAVRVSAVEHHIYDKLIEGALSFLNEKYKSDGCITAKAASEAEEMLYGMQDAAKSYRILCASHSHIDMNFLWGYDETVSVVLNTFRTMLALMEEYPEFIYSQSQAAAYRIVEEYDPEMLEEIKKRVKEGRWEVTASTWVESDKNMPSGESLARQILYAKKYLSSLFGIDKDQLNIDFEPDTFGHSINLPEILSDGGIRYYYYCRGHNDGGNPVFRWTSPSGRYVVAYKEPHWYDSRIEPSMALSVPEFCDKSGLKTMMKVYGVGDHGGGPTRRDIERIRDMASWPVFPEIRIGKYSEYFAMIEEIKEKLPVVKDELNFIFTGCYSSQSKIKTANKVSEMTLNEAELFSSISASNMSSPYYSQNFEKAWRYTLFNQFHDIVTGSCISEVREHAMGRFQEIMAAANTAKACALRSIAGNIDTSGFMAENEELSDSFSEGAGAGVGVHLFKVGECERGSGKTRIFHIFNPSFHEREEVTEITIWDWNGNVNNIEFRDEKGNKIEFQYVDKGFAEHWGHYYLRVLVRVKIPGCGYGTCIMTENEERRLEDVDPHSRDYPLVLENLPPTEQYDFVMENEYIRAVFDTGSLSIMSIIDKKTGEEFIDAGRKGGIFRRIEEDTCNGGGNAWIVGRYKKIESLNEGVKLETYSLDPKAVRKFITYRIEQENLALKVTVSLDCNKSRLDYNVECKWYEIGKQGEYAPQLNFYIPVRYECTSYKYDVPFGTIERKSMEGNVPANNWAVAQRGDNGKRVLMLAANSTYGFRGAGNALALTLMRGTFAPDPSPEVGLHRFGFAVSIADNTSNKELIGQVYDYNHPFSALSVKAGKGTLPQTMSFMLLESGSIAISALKMSEIDAGGKKLVIRAYETDGIKQKAVLNFHRAVSKAYFSDINERTVEDGLLAYIDDTRVIFDTRPFGISTICVEFK